MKRTIAGHSLSLAALVFLTDTAVHSSRSKLIGRLYGITPSESRVADLLLQGLDTREISEKLHITLETARFQTKRLLAKTGTKRQSELVRLLSVLPSDQKT